MFRYVPLENNCLTKWSECGPIIHPLLWLWQQTMNSMGNRITKGLQEHWTKLVWTRGSHICKITHSANYSVKQSGKWVRLGSPWKRWPVNYRRVIKIIWLGFTRSRMRRMGLRATRQNAAFNGDRTFKIFLLLFNPCFMAFPSRLGVLILAREIVQWPHAWELSSAIDFSRGGPSHVTWSKGLKASKLQCVLKVFAWKPWNTFFGT